MKMKITALQEALTFPKKFWGRFFDRSPILPDWQTLPMLLTIRQTAKLLHVHPNTLRLWDEQRRLPAVRLGSRQDRRYERERVREFWESRNVLPSERMTKRWIDYHNAVAEVRRRYAPAMIGLALVFLAIGGSRVSASQNSVKSTAVSPTSCSGWSGAQRVFKTDVANPSDPRQYTALNSARYVAADGRVSSGNKAVTIGALDNVSPVLNCSHWPVSSKVQGQVFNGVSLNVRISATGPQNTSDFAAIEASLDGQHWESVAVESASERPAKSFTFSLPFVTSFAQLQKLQIRVRVDVDPSTSQSVFAVDAISLTVQTSDHPANGPDEKKAAQQVDQLTEFSQAAYRSSESPILTVPKSKTDKLLFVTTGHTTWTVKQLTVTDPKGQVVDVKTTSHDVTQGNTVSSSIRIDPSTIRPGKYRVHVVTVDSDGNQTTTEKDFLWGVLALNPVQAVVHPGDLEQIQIGALDNQGHTICNANLSLTVTAPDGAKHVYQTSDDGILRNPTCIDKTATNTPDYRANIMVDQAGIYQLHLVAKTAEGERVLDDTFRSDAGLGFVVQRTTFPTRLYPVAPYDVRIAVTPAQDYFGVVHESVPASFAVSKVDSGGTVRIDPEHADRQRIEWTVDWKAGQTYFLPYTFDAPDISPELFLAGPLTIGGSFTEQPIFSEDRQWQMASDAVLPIDTADFTATQPDAVDGLQESYSAEQHVHLKLFKNGYTFTDPEEATKLNPARPTVITGVEVIGPQAIHQIGEQVIESTHEDITQNGRDVQLLHLTPDDDFRPGEYTLRLTIFDGVNTVTEDRTFLWGVLAINLRKSIEHTSTKTTIGLAILNELGKTQCNAPLTLVVMDPTGAKKTFTTADGTITNNPNCVDKGVTNDFDYSADYTTAGAGTYKLHLTGDAGQGEKSIDDTFEVRDSVPYDVERTNFSMRIYPYNNYDSSLTIVANQDYQGVVTETVPASFGISAISDEGTVSVSPDNQQQISWTVDWKAGETHTLGYTIDFPDVYPEFYQLGPLTIGNFAEARQWQIASDAAVTTAGSGNWNSTTPNAPWPGGTVPANGDDVTIAAGHTITVTNSPTINSIAFASPGTANQLTVNTGQTLTISAGVSFSNNATANNSTLELDGTAIVNVGTTFAMGTPGSTGQNRVITNAGTTCTTCQLNVTGATTLSNSSAVTNGIDTISIGTGTFSTGATTLTSVANGTGTALITASTGTLTFNSTLTFSGPTAAEVAVTTTGAGTTNFSGTISAGGTITMFAGTQTNMNATATISGAYTFSDFRVQTGTTTLGAALTTRGLQIDNGDTLANGGFLVTSKCASTGLSGFTINGTLSGTGATTLDTAGCTLDGSGTVSATGTFTLTNDKTIAGTANLTVGSSTSASAISASTTVTNNGTFTFAGTGAVTGSSGTTTIWTNAANSTLNIFSGTTTFLATGVLTATASPNTVNYAGATQTCKGNAGTQTYITLKFAGSGTKTCAITTPTVTNVEVAGGSWTHTTALTLSGNLTISGGTLITGAVAFIVTGTTSITSGTLTNTSNTGTKQYTGLVTLNGTGTLNGASTAIVFRGGITNTAGTVTITGTATFNTNSQVLAGTMTFATVVATTAVTNNGDVTITGTTTALTCTSLWQQGTGSVLEFSGNATYAANCNSNSATFDAHTNSNTVEYTRAGTQTGIVAQYYNLTFSGSGAKTCAVTQNILGNVTIAGTTTTWAGAGGSISIAGALNITATSGNASTQAAFNLTVNSLSMTGGGSYTLSATAGVTFTVSTTTTVTLGTLAVPAGTGEKRFVGLVTVNGGTLNGASANVTFRGGITQSSGSVSLTGTQTFNTNTNVLTGTMTLGTIVATTAITNNAQVTTAGTTNVITCTGVWTQGANSSITFTGVSPTFSGCTGGQFDAHTNNNTVTYGAAGVQTCLVTQYDNLTLSNTSVKTCAPTSPTLGDVNISGTASWAQSNTQSISGTFTIGNGTNAAGFTSANFQLDVTGLTWVRAAPSTFTHSGNTAINLNGGITVDGTLSGSGTGVITSGADVIGTGTITLNSGTTLQLDVSANESFGESTNANTWTFATLRFSNNSAGTPYAVSTVSNAAAPIIITTALLIGVSGDNSGATTELKAGDKTWTLSGTGSNPLTILSSPQGVLTGETSTFIYTGNANLTVENTASPSYYYNLQYAPALASSGKAYTLDTGATSVTNNFDIMPPSGAFLLTANIGSGGLTVGGTTTLQPTTATVNLTTTGSNYAFSTGGLSIQSGATFTGNATTTVTVTGNVTIAAGATLSSTSGNLAVGGDFANSNTFTHNSGTLTMNGTGTLTSGGSTLNNVTINSSGTVTVAAATHVVAGNLSLGGVGNPDFTGSTISMTGASKTIDGGGKTIENLTSSGSVTMQNTNLTVNGTFAQTAGSFTHGANVVLSVFGTSFTLSSGITWAKTSGTGKLILDNVTELIFADNTASKQDLGALQVGASPGTTTLSTDLSASSLTIPTGDTFNTKGYDVTISGAFDCQGTCVMDMSDAGTAGYEGDGTILTVGGNYTTSSSCTLTQETTNPRESQTIFNGSAAQTITTNGKAFQKLRIDNTGASGTTDDVTMSGALDVNNASDNTNFKDFDLNNGDLKLNSGNPTVTIAGSMYIGSSALVTKGTGSFIFDGTTAERYQDATATPQNIGPVTVNKTDSGSPATNNVLTLYSSMTVVTMNINGTGGSPDTLDLGNSGYTLKLAQSLSAPTSLLTVGGTLTPNSNSTVDYAGSSSAGNVVVTTTTYNNLSFSGVEQYDLGGNLTGANKVTGDITLGNLINGLDVTAAGCSGSPCNIDLAGSWTDNTGAFNSRTGSATVTFSSTTSGKTITTNSAAFNTVIFDGSSGGWSNSDTMTVKTDLIMTTGTLSGTNDVAVNGDVKCGASCGTITRTGGVFWQNVAASQAFGTSVNSDPAAWTFYDLTFGSSSGSRTITTSAPTSPTAVTVSDVLTIDTNTTLDAGTRTWVLAGASTPFVKTGSFTQSTSTIKYTGVSATMRPLTGVTYYNLTIQPASASTYQFTGGSSTTVSNALNVTGTAGQLVTMTTITGTTPYTITIGSATVTYADVNYLTISGTSFCATFSTSSSGVYSGFFISSGATCGIHVKGSCTAYDQSTTCGDLGTVRVAIDGSLDSATDTNGGNGGTFDITGVTTPGTGHIVTVFIDGAGSNGDKAVAVTKYDGSGDVEGVMLMKEHLTIGSDDNQTLSAAEVGSYDNSISGDADIFMDYRTDWTDAKMAGTAGSTAGLLVDKTGFSSQEELYIKSGNTFNPAAAIRTYNMELVGSMDPNVYDNRVDGSWDATSGVYPASGNTLIFTATSGSFNFTPGSGCNYTTIVFGEGSGSAQWTLQGDLTMNGGASIFYGTLVENGKNMNLGAGMYVYSPSGVYTDGAGLITFTNLFSTGWLDQLGTTNFGVVLIDGTSGGTVSAFTNITATQLTIGNSSGSTNTLALFTPGTPDVPHTLILTGTGTGSGRPLIVNSDGAITGSSSVAGAIVDYTGANATTEVEATTYSYAGVTMNPTLTSDTAYNFRSGTTTIAAALLIQPSATAKTLTVTLGGTTSVSGLTTVTRSSTATSILDTSASGNYTLSMTGLTVPTGGKFYGQSSTLTSASTANVTISGGELHSTTGTFTISGTFSHSSGTFDANGGTILMDGTTKNIAGSAATHFNNLTIDGTIRHTAGTKYIDGTLTVNSGKQFSLNNWMYASTNSTISVLGTGILDGSGTLDVQQTTAGHFTVASGTVDVNSVFFEPHLGDTVTMPAFTYTGIGGVTVAVYDYGPGSSTVNMSTGTTIISYDLIFDLGCTGANHNLTLAISTGDVTIHGGFYAWDQVGCGYSNSYQLDMGSGTWSVDGNFDLTYIPTLTQINGGTYGTLKKTGSGTVTDNGLTLGSLEVNSGTLTWADSTMALAGNFSMTGGTFSIPTTTSVGGSWTNTSGSLTNSGTTVTFNGTATGKTINQNGVNFVNVVFNGSGGAWSPSTNAMTITGDLTMTAGTFDTSTGTANVTVNGSVVCGGTCGTINMTSTNTFLQSVSTSGKTFGPQIAGTNDWTFYDLTFTAATGTQTVTANGTNTGKFIIKDVLTISNASTTLDAATRTWELNGAVTNPFVKTGTLTYSTSTFAYTGNGSVTVLALTGTGGSNGYYNLSITPTITGTTTYTMGGATNVNHDFTITPSAAGAQALTVNMAGTITVTALTTISGTTATGTLDTRPVSTNYDLSTGTLTIGTNGTLDASSSTSTISITGTTGTLFTLSGTGAFTAGSSIVDFTGNGSYTATSSGTFTFYDLRIQPNASTTRTIGFNASASITVNNNFRANNTSVPVTQTNITAPSGMTVVGTTTVLATNANVSLTTGTTFTTGKISVGVGGTLVAGATVTLTGTSGTLLSIDDSSGGVFTPGGNTVVVNTNNDVTVCTATLGVCTLSIVQLAPTALTGAHTYSLSGGDIMSSLTINPTSTGANTLTVNMGGTLTVSGTTTVQGSGSGPATGKLDSVGNTLTTGAINLAANGNLTVSSGSLITLNAASGVLFAKNASGTFSAGTGTVTVDTNVDHGTSNEITTGAITFNNLTLANSSALAANKAWSLNTGILTINGDFMINPMAASTAKTLTVTMGAGVAVAATKTTTITGTGTGQSTLDTKSGGNYALSSGFINVTNSGGGTNTLVANNSSITLTGTTGTPLTVSGVFTAGGSTVTYSGNGNITIASLTGSNAYNNLAFTLAVTSTSKTYTQGAGALTANGNFDISVTPAGSLTLTFAETGNITVAGVATIIQDVGGGHSVWNLDGGTPNAVSLGGLHIGDANNAYKGKVDGKTSTLTVTGAVINDDIFVASNGTMNFGGDYTNNATFTHGSGTVVLNGSAQQTLSGTLDGASGKFNTLTVSNNSGSNPDSSPSVVFAAGVETAGTFTAATDDIKLRFAAGATNTFNNINLSGSSGHLVTVRSDTPGTTSAFAVANASPTVTYASIKDNNSCGSTGGGIDASAPGTNLDLGNAVCWFINKVTFSWSGGNTLHFGALSTSVANGNWATTTSGATTETVSGMQFTFGTNAPSGAIVTVLGGSLGGPQTITPISGGAAVALSPGTEQFGLRINKASGSGSTTKVAPFNGAANNYGFNAGNVATIVNTGGGQSLNADTYDLYAAANITPTTKAGSYSTTLTFVATGTF